MTGAGTTGTGHRAADRTTPVGPLAELPLRPGAAKRAAELALRAAAPDADTSSGVLTWVRRTAAAHPDRVAVLDGGTVLGYAALAAEADRIRRVLAAGDCRRGDVVATVGPRSARTVAVYLALEGAGAVCLPLDASWPAARIAEVLAAGGARAVLASCDHADHADHAGPAGPAGPGAAGCGCGTAVREAAGLGLPVLRVPAAGEPSSARPPAPPEAEPRDQSREARYCLFTSGSTGRPKGVLVEHRGMMNHLWAKARVLSLTARDRVAFTAPPGFVVSIWQMLAPLLVGGSVAVVREGDCLVPRRLLDRLERTGATVTQHVPTVLRWLTDEAERSGRPRLTGARWLISTGQELPSALAGRVRTAFPRARLLNAYGSTECSDDVAHHEVTSADRDGERVPLGRPIGGAPLYVLVADADADADAEAGAWRAAEPGEVGELFVGGAAVGLGYVLAADPGRATPAFFRDPLDPASPTGRLYRTGDLVRVTPEGVRYTGRADRQVKVAGVRMELEDIEAAVRRHPLVLESAVLVRDADPPGLLALFTARRPMAPQEVRELRTMLAEHLPAAMVPRELVQVAAFPLNGNGKIDHAALRGSAREPRRGAGAGHHTTGGPHAR
ncbi:hypothetical protein GCM10027168_09610 [Streptomyces capparidis]